MTCQECERVKALYDELRKCNFRVIESGDTLEVLPIRDEAEPGNARPQPERGMKRKEREGERTKQRNGHRSQIHGKAQLRNIDS